MTLSSAGWWGGTTEPSAPPTPAPPQPPPRTTQTRRSPAGWSDTTPTPAPLPPATPPATPPPIGEPTQTAPPTTTPSRGGLVGQNGGKITASYATGDGAAVGKNTHAGGLVGDNNGGINAKAAITASYSLGKPSAATGTGTERKGGLVGANRNDATITASYWDKTTSEITTGSNGVGKTTSQLQTPTAYGTGSSIYANWNVNVDDKTGNDDPWDFGTTSQYPRPKIRQPRTGQAARRSNHHRVPHNHLGTRRHRTKPRQRIHHHRIAGR